MKQDLCRIASTLNSLVPHSGQQSTPLNFAVGAVSALVRAEALAYDAQNEPGRGLRMWDMAKQVCQQIAEGLEPPMKAEWWAGYFFNDAIIRIAVAFEHLVRQETNLHGYEHFDEMKEMAIAQGFDKKWMDSWKLTHEELNRIRHRNKDFIDGPLVTYDQAVVALSHLAEALESSLGNKEVKPQR